ncbi:YgiQ family radical SAM protein [Methanimicrococcus blatticola]|nr:YgiQ family radical SAM protein [Methanimicrococcus blatticola]MBZ3936325.1 YgiQ family radical SAM protein [Methanimicrococcus blatticola]MCC2508329.1 YgiQ family radical SAM protein [Methanimicrococcus blatticola]
MSLEEARQKGWDELDIILITGDAYVDHSGFGTAIIGRVLEHDGFRVGVIAQPDWTSKDAFEILGKPRLFFSVSAGNADSLVNNYTPLLYKRESDMYSPGGEPGLRPDRAVIAYANRLRQAYPDVPIIAGGIEASLRRFAEFDYLSNDVRQSVLADAPIDMIIYGMGELQAKEIAARLNAGEKIADIRNIPGTVWKMPVREWKNIRDGHDSEYSGSLEAGSFIELPDFKEVSENKEQYARAFKIIYENQNPVSGKKLVQPHPKTVIIQNPPMRELTEKEMDDVYELPYLRLEHPSYTEGVPGLDVVKNSITSHRGCFGGCSFCAITQHQGRAISNRSEESIIREAEQIATAPDFNGIISGIGGPSANMYGMTCPTWEKKGACTHKNCLVPTVCPSLNSSHERLLKLLETLRNMPNVRKVLTGYGVRFDLALQDDGYLETLCQYHVGGQLKVAPEHFCDNVTAVMRKPNREAFEKFEKKFKDINRELDLKQFLVTFQISGHPGCTMENAVEMAEYIRDNNRYTEQVQDFTPTPMTISTCMFHTGLNPFTMEKIYVPVTRTEKKMQRVLLQFRNPDNREMVEQALEAAGREDLIGSGPECLIPRNRANSYRY